MTVSNPAHDALLTKISAADQRWRMEKVIAMQRHKKLAELDIANTLALRDAYIRQAFDAGVPKARLKEALHTTAQITVDQSLARTALSSAEIAEAATSDPRYTIDPEGVLMVSLSGEDLELACEAEDWTVADATKAGVTTATFTVTPMIVKPIEARFLPEYGRKHPIISWVDRQHDEIHQWYQERVAVLA